jgi:uncharacterized protein YbbC (DUF1343 family)
VTDRQAVRSMRMGIEIAAILKQLYPSNFDPAKLMLLTGSAETIRQLQRGTSPEQIASSWTSELSSFDALRRKYFLYR